MTLKIKCPSCGRQFSIEPTAAMREIERLKKDNADLRAKISAMEMMKRGGGKDPSIEAVMKAMGL